VKSKSYSVNKARGGKAKVRAKVITKLAKVKAKAA